MDTSLVTLHNKSHKKNCNKLLEWVMLIMSINDQMVDCVMPGRHAYCNTPHVFDCHPRVCPMSESVYGPYGEEFLIYKL